jgi:hypothetical protein
MSQQDDRPDDAPTEWLSPALYRQLCDAVDAALFAPPDARDALLAARLGSDQRLLAEARALLASHESSPRTFITESPISTGDETFISRPASDTIIRRESATVIVPGSGSRRAAIPAEDSTAQMRALSGPHSGPHGAESDGTVSIPAPQPLADTSPRVPIAAPPVSSPGRPAWGPVAPIDQMPPPMPPPMPAPQPPPMAAPLPQPVSVAPPERLQAPPPAPEPPAAPAPAPVRGIDIGAPIPTRRSGSSGGSILGFVVAGVCVIGLGVSLYLWRQATTAQAEAEVRRVQAEKRFTEVRKLGVALVDIDRQLAASADPGALAARQLLLTKWMAYLTDLQRASGSTERELLLEVAKGYRQAAAAQGGLTGRTLGDRTGAIRTLMIAEQLWSWLDRNSPQPERAIVNERLGTHIDLGDLHAVGKDTAKANDQYQKAMQLAPRLKDAGVSDADVQRQRALIQQRLQSGPPAPPPAVVEAAPITQPEQP